MWPTTHGIETSAVVIEWKTNDKHIRFMLKKFEWAHEALNIRMIWRVKHCTNTKAHESNGYCSLTRGTGLEVVKVFSGLIFLVGSPYNLFGKDLLTSLVHDILSAQHTLVHSFMQSSGICHMIGLPNRNKNWMQQQKRFRSCNGAFSVLSRYCVCFRFHRHKKCRRWLFQSIDST